MKLLLDQGLPRSAVRFLREDGLDAVHTGDVGLASASDREILQWAAREGRTVVTLDADFHALVALSGASGPSVIRIRIERLGPKEMADVLRAALAGSAEEASRGALIVLTPGGIRIRQLPIGRK